MRGPDKKPRKRRTDNPARFLPNTEDAHRIAKERGNHVGRPWGSRTGWTRKERRISLAMAQAQAKLMVDYWYKTGEWPGRETRATLYEAIPRQILQQWTAMLERRKERAETFKAVETAAWQYR